MFSSALLTQLQLYGYWCCYHIDNSIFTSVSLTITTGFRCTIAVTITIIWLPVLLSQLQLCFLILLSQLEHYVYECHLGVTILCVIRLWVSPACVSQHCVLILEIIIMKICYAN